MLRSEDFGGYGTPAGCSLPTKTNLSRAANLAVMLCKGPWVRGEVGCRNRKPVGAEAQVWPLVDLQPIGAKAG